MRHRNWRHRAACRNIADPEIFFQLSESSPLTEKAQRFCARCPVTDECLTYAVVHNCWGVWGGVYRPEPTTAAGERARRAARRAMAS